jgi:ferredoxin
LSGDRRVVVDPHLCEGHALCLESAPEVFDLSVDEVATCVEQPTGDRWQLVLAAIDACPRGAISIVEDTED